jgi:thiol-disulfide isomerase/thioredoxin
MRSLFLATLLSACTMAAAAPLAPEFTHQATAEWLNSEPQSLATLRGKVVLVEFWTFECGNCRNTLPWMKAMHERFGRDGLVMVGVHTPEFANERDPSQVRAAVAKLGIRYPVMLDADSSYWNALGNRYWPAFYLIDREGHIARTAIGELHRGTRDGDQMESSIEQLLAGGLAGKR